MTSPASFDPKTTPSITLDGKEWPVPELVPRQLRHIRNALLEMNNRLGKQGSGDEASKASDAFLTLDDADYDRLLLKPLYWALTRAHPSLTEDEFQDLRATDSQLITGWYVVRAQSGLFVFSDGEGGAPQTGEAPAA